LAKSRKTLTPPSTVFRPRSAQPQASNKPELAIRTLPGPNLFAPFAAVVARFTMPTAIALPRHGTLPEVISDRLPQAVIARIQTLDRTAPFETLVAGLAQALQDWHGPNNLPCRTDRIAAGLGRVCLGYYDERATSYALQLAYGLALAALAAGQESISAYSALGPKLVRFGELMRDLQPDQVERALTRVARRRAIPFYRVAPGVRILQYGQGKHGLHFNATSSQFDSHIGVMLQHDKMISNNLVRSLGFPGVEHGVADTAPGAIWLASRIGYPLVIKPVNSRGGQGVTAGVTSEQELELAFEQANAISPGRVIVEKLVEGEDHRLTVLCGRFAYALLRSPPRLMGDGKHTIMELIDLENERRPGEGYPKKLKVDPAMISVLQKQNLLLNERVPAGKIVTLRSAANADAGGTFEDVTDRVHVDNQRMVEAIARCFRLHTIGIDFLSADITKSWSEVRCAVIEVNSAPTILTAERTELLLERTFPDRSTGRIPSVIMVNTEAARAREAVPILERAGLTVGFVDRALISLGGEPRQTEDVRLAERVQGLLLDPACEALVVACTPQELINDGLPLDRCSLCVIEFQVPLSGPLRGLLEQCSDQLAENTPTETALTRWLNDTVLQHRESESRHSFWPCTWRRSTGRSQIRA
jgi:D-alanine-D-alanine ligase-like ATP-grasp enzyme